MTVVDYSVLTGDKPYKPLLKNIPSRAGRNSQGRITMRHQGGGNKRRYRMVDFNGTDRLNQKATVKTIEYDPYRTAFIALIEYADGVKRYMLAPHGLTAGQQVVTAEIAPLVPGNRVQLKNIPVGYQICNVELRPRQGGVLARSAGSYAEVLANADGLSELKISSGEVRKVSWDSFATIGQISNPEHGLVSLGKAGHSRWLGVRPTVRGSAMNPVDHPYGGGEGRQPRGTKRPKDIWGNVTGGRKTRNKRKWSNKMIVKRRK